MNRTLLFGILIATVLMILFSVNLAEAKGPGSCKFPSGKIACGGTGAPPEGLPSASCFCDSVCKKYGDCCDDFDQVCSSILPPPPAPCAGEGKECGGPTGCCKGFQCNSVYYIQPITPIPQSLDQLQSQANPFPTTSIKGTCIPTCSDSDKGKKPFVYGSVQFGNEVYYDHCVDKNTVLEYSCSYDKQGISCPQIAPPLCSEGTTLITTTDQNGCVSYTCSKSVNTCPVPENPPPTYCPDGKIITTTDKDGCVSYTCPKLPPTFIGLPIVQKDAIQCPKGHICGNGYCYPDEGGGTSISKKTIIEWIDKHCADGPVIN